MKTENNKSPENKKDDKVNKTANKSLMGFAVKSPVQAKEMLPAVERKSIKEIAEEMHKASNASVVDVIKDVNVKASNVVNTMANDISKIKKDVGDPNETDASNYLPFNEFFKSSLIGKNDIQQVFLDVKLITLLKLLAGQHKVTLLSLTHNIVMDWKNRNTKEINKAIKKSLL